MTPQHRWNSSFKARCEFQIQLLHFIVQYEGKGGETQLTDGARVCQQLREANPRAFHTLSTVPVDFKNVTKSDNGQAHFKLLKAPVIT